VPTRFLQLHFLTSYPAALLNRDDAGFAKRVPFGGAVRTRISSQCLKRHWRTADGPASLGDLARSSAFGDLSVRSRLTFDRYLLRPLLDEGIDPALASAVASGLMGVALGLKDKESEGEEGKRGKGKAKGATEAPAAGVAVLKTEQVTVLGRPELDFLLAEARRLCEEVGDPAAVRERLKNYSKDRAVKENFAALRQASGLDAALFGRMVTSDLLARSEAALHVAHALTVHAEATETDYFSVVDDLSSDDGEQGSGHINTAELTSGLYYGYVVVHLPQLVSNLEGCKEQGWQDADRKLAADVVRQLTHLVATVSPGAKVGSTAPYNYAHLLLIEAGDRQPRTLANAFLRPIDARQDLLATTYRSLASHLVDFDSVYGQGEERRLLACQPRTELEPAFSPDSFLSLDKLADWAAGQVLEAR
jgi:CRISPR system Cascade subunit CasC